jgi:hypothetical protein
VTFPKGFFTLLFIGLMSISGTDGTLKRADDLQHYKTELRKCQAHYDKLAKSCWIVTGMFERCVTELNKERKK